MMRDRPAIPSSELGRARDASGISVVRCGYVLVAWVGLVLGDSPVLAKTVRVFAVGSKLEIRYADTYEHFHDKMAALFDQARRDTQLVQADVDDVASHLQPADPSAPDLALVNFPEDVGLVAALIGSRGAAARRATIHNGGSEAAFGSLIQNYDAQIDYYTGLYPGELPVRYLLLAETDTLYRAVYETFQELARTYHVYLTATVNVAPARRVEAADQPDLVALLRDPDEAQTRSYAYVAESSQVFNTTFIFDPDGNIVFAGPDGSLLRSPADTDGLLRGSVNKAYLTETEEGTLPLAFGRVQDLDVVDTPVGRLGVVISKDAWMIDVNDRFEAKGANLIVQPEAFSEWGYAAAPWQPDVYKAGGFAQLQRNPNFLYNVAPSMTGNLYEVTFDGQSSILAKRRKDEMPSPGSQSAWIGQNPDSGFLSIAPWIIDDPGVTDPSLTLAERRTLLADAGMHLLPGMSPRCATPTTYGACENGYREAVIFADVQLPNGPYVLVPPDTSTRVPTAFGPNIAVRSAAGLPRRYARVAAHAGNVYVVWQDARYGSEEVFLAISTDGGGHFEEHQVSDNVPGQVVELRPALALSPTGEDVFVAWQEFCSGLDDDCGRIKLAHFDSLGEKLGPDLRIDDADGVGKWNVALAVTRTGNPLLAWVDERDVGDGGLRFEHIYFSRGRQKGRIFGPNVRVDAGLPASSAASLDNKWAPAVASGGLRMYVVWTDFRNYMWDIFAAHSFHGTHFSANVRVDDAAGLERLHDHPSVAADQRGTLHVVWADRRDTASDTNIFYGRSTDGGRTFVGQQRIDSSEVGFDPDRDTTSNQWHPRLAVSGDDVLAVWQDNRSGNNDIFYVRSRNRGMTFERDERVDDSGEGPSNQYRPDIAVDDADPQGRVVYVVWEDDRDALPGIFMARRLL